MTGFPGFIAERLLARLARADVQFYLLVQPQFVEKAMQDVERIAFETATPLEHFVLVKGDITQPDLGIVADDLNVLRAEITDIFHLAAIYDLEVSKDAAMSVNVEGTRNVNAFARSVESLHRYNYVSTCYVAGGRNGRILETELEHSDGFLNFYEESKYLAELEVENLKTKINVTIYRPSVVVGDSKTGETAKYDGIYYLIKYLMLNPNLLRLVNVGNKDVRLNLVPVDFVAESIAKLSEDDNAVGKTVALADPHPLTTEDLFDLIAEKLSGKRSIWTPPVSLVKPFLSSSISPKLTGLPLSAVPYFYTPKTYDTSIAEELLEPHNVKCADFRAYVSTLLDFVRKHTEI